MHNACRMEIVLDSMNVVMQMEKLMNGVPSLDTETWVGIQENI